MDSVQHIESEKRKQRERDKKTREQQELATFTVRETQDSQQKNIALPQGMSPTKAMRVLHAQILQDETHVAIHEVVDAWPLDGAVAFQHVLEEKYGFVQQVPIPGFFGDRPPSQVGVRIDAKGNTRSVSWGRMEISVLDHATLDTGFIEENGSWKFLIQGNVKKKFLKEIEDIARRTRQRVRSHSIYKGKAIRLDFRDEDGDRKCFDPSDSPVFIDIDREKVGNVVYNKDVEAVVHMALLNPIKYPDACRRIGVPLKRGALLEGPYGTGKTLTAYEMALHGTDNGFTFIYLMDVRDLDMAMKFAEHYAPAIVFAEDIDQIAKLGQRDRAEINRLTNILDGVDAKGREIFTVFTTNYKSAIDGCFLRPGRLDCVVTLSPPDTGAAVRLVRQYGRDEHGNSILNPELTDEAIGRAIDPLVELEANAAFYRETVERAKLAALPGYVQDGMLSLTEENLHAAAVSMESHIELLRQQSPQEHTNTIGDDVMAAAMASFAVPPPNIIKKMMKQMMRSQKPGF